MSQNLLELRKVLDDIMCRCLNRRVAIYGGGYTSSYIRWYAKYFHGIDIAFDVDESYTKATSQDKGIFLPTIFRTNYKDIRQCIIWIARCDDINSLKQLLDENGFVENGTYYDLCKAVYGEDLFWQNIDSGDEFHKLKSGKRDIQDLEWLEWKYGCNFITPVASTYFAKTDCKKHAERYSSSTASDVFEILSRIHARTGKEDGFFDFGCGKGGAVISALEYGFVNAGGVEFEPDLYEVLQDNFSRLNTIGDRVELIHGDAGKLEEELDKYNYYYFYDPFYAPIMEQVMGHISESLRRRKRKAYIISRCYNENADVIRESHDFRLCNQFEVNTANRICEIYESIV